MGKEEHFASKKSSSQIISLHKAKIRSICGGLESIKMATQAKDSPSPAQAADYTKSLAEWRHSPLKIRVQFDVNNNINIYLFLADWFTF